MRFKPKVLFLVLAAAGLLLAGGFAFSTQEAAVTDQEFEAAVQAVNNYGILVRTEGAVQILNPATNTLGPALLNGQMGSEGGGLFDVVISPNGKKAFVSNFGDSRIICLDLTNPTSPQMIGWVNIPFFAEDMSITPDGKYVLCTDGGFSSRVAVIDAASRTVINNYALPGGRQAQCVEIAANGKTVMVADYWNCAAHVLILDPATGALAYAKSFYLDGARLPAGVLLPPDFWKAQFLMRPVNINISPDGRTAVANDVNMDQIAVFRIDGPGNVVMTQITGTYPRKPQYQQPIQEIYVSGQSFAFTPNGTKLFAYGNYHRATVISSFRSEVLVYDVVAAGKLKPAYVTIPLTPTRGTSQLFGVDCMAVDPSGRFLYVTNPTLSGGDLVVSIIKVATNSFLRNIWLVDPPYNSIGLPTGIAFRRQ